MHKLDCFEVCSQSVRPDLGRLDGEILERLFAYTRHSELATKVSVVQLAAPTGRGVCGRGVSVLLHTGDCQGDNNACSVCC